MRQTLMKNNTPPMTTGRHNRVKRNQTWRTQRVKEIQNTHQNHREKALKNIEQQHSQRRSSLQLRLQARNKKKEGEEKVTEGVALRGNETETEKVVVNGGSGGGATATNTRPEAALATPNKMDEQMKASVETIRQILNKLMKTQSRLQKWMVHRDKTSTGLLARANFTQVVWKVVKKVGKEEQKERLVDGIWASVKEGSARVQILVHTQQRWCRRCQQQ